MKKRCLLLDIREPGETFEALVETGEKPGGMGGQEGEQQENFHVQEENFLVQSSEDKQKEKEDISVLTYDLTLVNQATEIERTLIQQGQMVIH